MVAAASPLQADPADDQYRAAADHFDAQRGRQAADEFQKFLQAFPDDSRAGQSTFFLAEALLQSDQWDAARRQFEKYLAVEPEGKYARPALFRRGEAAYLSGRFAVAKPDLEAFLAKYPNDRLAAYALPYLGEIVLAGGDADSAAARFREGLERFPEGPMGDECRQGLDRAKQKQREADEAKRLDPAEVLWTAARSHEKAGRLEQAAASYRRLADEHSEFPHLDAVLYEWAWVEIGLQRPDDAFRLFERLHKDLSQSRYWADATCRLAERAADQKNIDRAAALFDEILAAKADPQVREYALFLRGQVAMTQGDWPKAREAFETLVKQFSESRKRSAAEFLIAEAYYRQGDFAEAAPRFQRLGAENQTQREPWTGIVPLRCAQIFARQGRWSEAQKIAASIAADYAGFGQQYEVDYLLGRCLAGQGDFDAARAAVLAHGLAGKKARISYGIYGADALPAKVAEVLGEAHAG